MTDKLSPNNVGSLLCGKTLVGNCMSHLLLVVPVTLDGVVHGASCDQLYGQESEVYMVFSRSRRCVCHHRTDVVITFSPYALEVMIGTAKSI